MTVRLNDLRESNEFLNSLIDNINSAVFIVDKTIKIQQFNRALRMLFNRSEPDLEGELCGNALGCSFTVTEQRPCGETSHCGVCELRHSILRAFGEKIPTYRRKLNREFYIDGSPVQKHLEFTTRYIVFNGEEMILIIVDDVTEGEMQRQELIRRQKKLDEDLKAAAGIQRALLPRRFPNAWAVEIGWKFLPCDLIGGDIFSVFQLGTDLIGCYMLDVSGHGVSSALVTVSVSQSLRPSSPLEEMPPPSAVCVALDDEYPFERFNTFFSIVYMILNTRTGELVYTNAGHPPIAVVHAGGEVEFLSEGGPIIGLGGILPYTEARYLVRPGDKILLYTDGLIERRNSDGEFYGQARLTATFRDLRHRPIAELISEVIDSVMTFGEGRKLDDDLSILGLDFSPP